MFEVIREIDRNCVNSFHNSKNSRHIRQDRRERMNCINNLNISENSKILHCFEINTGHRNGAEVHIVRNNGIVEVFNTITKTHIASIIARPQQIQRYYNFLKIQVPEHTLKLCQLHKQLKLNK